MCAAMYGWRHLVKAIEVIAGLVESNSSLPLGGWLEVTCGLTACTPGSALGPTRENEYARIYFFCLSLFVNVFYKMS